MYINIYVLYRCVCVSVCVKCLNPFSLNIFGDHKRSQEFLCMQSEVGGECVCVCLYYVPLCVLSHASPYFTP